MTSPSCHDCAYQAALRSAYDISLHRAVVCALTGEDTAPECKACEHFRQWGEKKPCRRGDEPQTGRENEAQRKDTGSLSEEQAESSTFSIKNNTFAKSLRSWLEKRHTLLWAENPSRRRATALTVAFFMAFMHQTSMTILRLSYAGSGLIQNLWEICPPFLDGFRLPAFFASNGCHENEKILGVSHAN